MDIIEALIPTLMAPSAVADTPDNNAEQKKICYLNWKPPPVPPQDLIGIEFFNKDIKKRLFKVDDEFSYFHDETRKVKLLAETFLIP